MARFGKWAGLLAAVAIAVATPAGAREPDMDGGVKIGRASFVRKLYSAEKLEKTAALQYDQLKGQAVQKHALLPESHPTSQRVKEISRALLPYAKKWNDRADKWDWEVNVINSGNVNAFCMPGGKIVVFTGIIDKLKLTDDELAMIIGHEIAHALREHSRARAAKTTLTNIGTMAVSVLVGGNAGEIARMGGGLLGLKFSRSDETEADLIGMELAARAGYNPQSGVHLWEKMSAAAKGAPMEFMSTHPSGTTRIATIKANLKDVMPLYERARARRLN